MKPLSTFQSISLNGYHGNDDRHRNFDFSFPYVFPISMTVQSFINIKWQGQEKRPSVIKIFRFLFLTTLIFIVKKFDKVRRALTS